MKKSNREIIIIAIVGLAALALVYLAIIKFKILEHSLFK